MQGAHNRKTRRMCKESKSQQLHQHMCETFESLPGSRALMPPDILFIKLHQSCDGPKDQAWPGLSPTSESTRLAPYHDDSYS